MASEEYMPPITSAELASRSGSHIWQPTGRLLGLYDIGFSVHCDDGVTVHRDAEIHVSKIDPLSGRCTASL
jgi:hypothetical protein